MNLVKIKSFFQGLFLFLFVMSVASWLMTAIVLQFFLPFNFVFLLNDIVIFIFGVYVPLRAGKNKWCRKMFAPQEKDWPSAIALILATIINIMYWDVVSLMYLSILGLG